MNSLEEINKLNLIDHQYNHFLLYMIPYPLKFKLIKILVVKIITKHINL